jgi:hypothetical protein
MKETEELRKVMTALLTTSNKTGWTVEDTTLGALLFVAPVLGYVTVDPVMRSFRLGVGQVNQRGKYSGRGWMKLLAEDAMRALEACA